MKPVTNFEVYQVKFDRWALRQRLAAHDQDRALELGRQMEAESGLAVQVVEENLDYETGETTLRVIKRFGKAEPDIKGPAEDTDMGARIFMVALNAFGIGAIVAVIAAIALAPMQARNAEPGAYNMLLFFIFAAAMLASGLMLFKIYVPVDFILWRSKTPEERTRTTEALLLGSSRTDAVRPVRPPFRDRPAAPIAAAAEAVTGADQTSFQIAPLADPQGAAEATAQDTPAVAWPPEIAAAREVARNTLFIFADAALSILAVSRPQMQAFERFGLNLYLGGAAIKACDMVDQSGVVLPQEIRRELLALTLERAGTNAGTIQSFVERLEPSLGRPRYKALAEAGGEAFTAPPG